MFWKELKSYLLAFAIGSIIIVYLLDVGSIITGNKEIVHSYYNYLPNLLLDLFFVWAYLMVAAGIIKYFEIVKELYKFIIVIITTLVITSLWCLYFRSKPVTSAFFSKWFNAVGYSSAVYDAVLVSFIYLIYVRLMKIM
jgi:hypothetical protein